MTNQQAIKELQMECKDNEAYCGCKSNGDCKDCYIKTAIKALERVIKLNE